MTKFQQKIYQKLSQVPAGKITTYRDLAHSINSIAYRAVGQAMRHNPFAPKVPCHRVIASDGSLGGFMGSRKPQELNQKIALLQKEGIKIKNNRILNFKKHLHHFSENK